MSTHVVATPKEWSKAVRGLSLPSTPYPPFHTLHPPPHPCVLPHILLGVLHHAFWCFVPTPMFVSCVQKKCLRQGSHPAKQEAAPAFNCFEVTTSGGLPDCRLVGFSGALALAAASAHIYGSVVATCAWQAHLRWGRDAIRARAPLFQRSTVSRLPRPEDSQISGSWAFPVR